MSMSMMNRTAPVSLLCCGVQNGGGAAVGVSRFRALAQTFSQKREEELDGYTEEADGWPVKPGINERELPRENRVQVGASGREEPLMPDLEKESRELLRAFYRSHTRLPAPCSRSGTHPALPSLRRVVGNVLCKHRTAYNGMVQRLFDQSNGLDSVSSVLSGVFSDSVVSWGRIASVLALGAVVCERLKQDCVKEHAEECVDIVASRISSYLSTELQHWFINNNGWAGFVEFFHVEDPESTVRNALMAVAGLGIGACLLTLMR
ncbi:induced myeloid leukemia cell differentiation protein Mcl-1a [Pangasianodon hypophthalmus]|uniref:induced myeloid leukemia cell differentiation protein Mcl-1a n=1 Tax=Pangasianodon hypophthalmus TaxID=310915 RepID=UPI000EFEAB2A|nr:induced myeloid leukemia cell differentiation protein Mcl-1a [Pangasianodon hypophthalmus]